MLALTFLGGGIVFFLGLLHGIWYHESGAVPTLSVVLLAIVAPSFVLICLVSVALWRQVRAPALVGTLLGALLSGAWVMGLVSSVAVTDRTLADYGSDEGWESLLTFQLTLWITTGAFLGFLSTLTIRIVAGAYSWLTEHIPAPTGKHPTSA